MGLTQVEVVIILLYCRSITSIVYSIGRTNIVVDLCLITGVVDSASLLVYVDFNGPVRSTRSIDYLRLSTAKSNILVKSPVFQ